MQHCPQVGKIFAGIEGKTSAGDDSIPNVVLKKAPPSIIRAYTIIFKDILNNAYYPKAWKTASVVVLPKKGKYSSKPNNYRPISLMLNCSKLFEAVFNGVLNNFAKREKIIPPDQFGFQHRLSTVHAVNKFTSDLSAALAGGKVVAACLIDLEKAFDSIWIKGLIFKMANMGFPTQVLNMLASLFRGTWLLHNGPRQHKIQFFQNVRRTPSGHGEHPPVIQSIQIQADIAVSN